MKKKRKLRLLAKGLLERYENKKGKLYLVVDGVIPQTEPFFEKVSVYIEEVKE